MTNTEIVLAFIDAWNNMDWDKTSELMTEDVVWHNIPMAEVKGKIGLRACRFTKEQLRRMLTLYCRILCSLLQVKLLQRQGHLPVSYTHLTLPTNREV